MKGSLFNGYLRYKDLDSDRATSLMLTAAASLTILSTCLIFMFVFKEALPLVAGPDAGKLLALEWLPVSLKEERFGILPLINGSLMVTVIALLVSVPVSIMSAIYIAFLAGPRESRILKPIIELLASMPSVVIGFVGMVALVPAVKALLGLSSGLTGLTGGLILGLMAAPTVVTLSEDALRAVPDDFMEASLSVGASRVESIFRVMVPAATPGIVAAILLGLGRILGETMAVLMVTGNSPILSLSPLQPVRTMTATIAAEMGEVIYGSTHYSALFVVGGLLLITTFVINLLARLLLLRVRHQQEAL